MGKRFTARKKRFADWFAEQNNDEQWIKEQQMPQYIQVIDGFLNYNDKGLQKNSKAPSYRSSGSGKSAMVVTQDIPKGSIIAFGAWGGSGQYGKYIKLSGQLVLPDQMPQEQPQEQPAQTQVDPAFDDDIPF